MKANLKKQCPLFRQISVRGGGGGGEPEGGGHKGKLLLERGGFDVKFNTKRGGRHSFSHSFSQNGKVVEEPLEFKYLYLLTLELNWENMKNSRCFDL